ncbi:hypothetical protein C5B42_01875 [Candidatus Cerribacteria bacterium 'Amazon FNV 2010 28 9']|uniref:Uncharacterized protein n=1 Tax=Candidatus Cerribacteria bacterium 'Amazon FNV 2010 28 9' TaxID=2081795 RepID=A0A317JUJ1_9BACT|nr:MAG: hypothetical protein C5B42_01875 [Candidatus Cerribacteria bacterium 'Amazon FNV 2010 28 9']
MARTVVKRATEVVVPEVVLSYHIGVVAVGLLRHPYKTVQDVVRSKIPGIIILFPIFVWMVASIILRVFDDLFFAFIPFIGFWWFFFVWVSVFTLLWQILLLYLYFRFSSVMK